MKLASLLIAAGAGLVKAEQSAAEAAYNACFDAQCFGAGSGLQSFMETQTDFDYERWGWDLEYAREWINRADADPLRDATLCACQKCSDQVHEVWTLAENMCLEVNGIANSECVEEKCPGAAATYENMKANTADFNDEKWSTDSGYVFGLLENNQDMQTAVKCVCGGCHGLVNEIWPVGNEVCIAAAAAEYEQCINQQCFSGMMAYDNFKAENPGFDEERWSTDFDYAVNILSTSADMHEGVKCACNSCNSKLYEIWPIAEWVCMSLANEEYEACAKAECPGGMAAYENMLASNPGFNEEKWGNDAQYARGLIDSDDDMRAAIDCICPSKCFDQMAMIWPVGREVCDNGNYEVCLAAECPTSAAAYNAAKEANGADFEERFGTDAAYVREIMDSDEDMRTEINCICEACSSELRIVWPLVDAICKVKEASDEEWNDYGEEEDYSDDESALHNDASGAPRTTGTTFWIAAAAAAAALSQ